MYAMVDRLANVYNIDQAYMAAGMPTGSPGMEAADGATDEYSVVLFGPVRHIYARFKGAQEIAH